MECFNEIAEDGPKTSYFSMGSKKKGLHMNKVLQNGHKMLVNDTWGVQCDGII